MLESARDHAGTRGYALEYFQLREGAREAQSLQRILRSRGVEGILLLPFSSSTSLDEGFDWSTFSVVAATTSVRSPLFHRTMPNHFANAMSVCEEALSRGYRRLGLLLDESADARVNHAYSAAIEWFSQHRAGARIPPLYLEGAEENALQGWLHKHRPEVLITIGEQRCRLLSRLGSPVEGGLPPGVINLSVTNKSAYTGIDEHPEQMARMAVDLLVNMIQHGERGVPARGISMMVSGQWIEGRTLPVLPSS